MTAASVYVTGTLGPTDPDGLIIGGPLSPTELRDTDVLLLGAGVSGPSACQLLHTLGARVTVAEDNPDRFAALDASDSGPLARCTTAEAVDRVGDVTLVVTSPGWRPASPVFAAAARAGVPVWGDVELAWRADRERIAGTPRTWLVVTGTNGKTTTTGMLAAICAAAGMPAIACGNIGLPVTAALLATEPRADVLVAELSSFQLHWAPSVTPLAGAVLNIAEDHLDWHGSLDAYAADKARALRGYTAVVGTDDERAAALAESSPAHHVVGFTAGAPEAGEVGIRQGMIVDDAFGEPARSILPSEGLSPPGRAGLLNATAACALALAAGATPHDCAAGLRSFRVEPHRGAVVADHAGHRWIDDSKATNPHAAAAALAGATNAVWIAGGQLKGADIAPLVAKVAPRLRGAVVLGTDAPLILDAFRELAPDIPVAHVNSTEPREAMREAVDHAFRLIDDGTPAGGDVILAPAAASLDMFASYGQRGDLFAEAVRERTATTGESR